MKKLFKYHFSKLPNWIKLCIGGLLTLIALSISSLLPIQLPTILKYILPVGLILLIFFNFLLFRAEDKGLEVLGFDLRKRNLAFLPTGLFIGIIAYAINYIFLTSLREFTIQFNPSVNITKLIGDLLILLPMAATQQFIIRSYTYIKAIELTNLKIATFLFGIIFISLHNVYNGDLFNTIFFSLSLFISHLLFSIAFIKSRSIYFSIGIHWGCNVANDYLMVENLDINALFYALPQEISTTNNAKPGILGILLFFTLINSGYILAGIIIWKWKFFRGQIENKSNAN